MAKRQVVLFGADGRPLRLKAAAYDAAGAGRRAANWWPTADSVNSIASYESETLAARSRDLVRRNPGLATARERYVSNIVGTGIVPVSQSPDVELKRALRAKFDEWVDEADADGLTDFYGQQGLVMGQTWEAGECFARLRPRRSSDGLSVPLQIQLLERDFLRSTMNENLSGGRRIRQGIEFDPIGRRVAYHFYREHPGERFSYGGATTTRVPVDEVLQVFEPMRPGQLRGLPRTAPILAKLYEIDQFDDATLLRQKIAAFFAVFFTSHTETGLTGDEELDPDDVDAFLASVQSGSALRVPPGDDVRFPTPPSTGDYKEFMVEQWHQVAGPLDVTYEQLTGNLSEVNYSSIRAGLLEIRRRHEQVQHGVLAFRFNRPIWQAWVRAAVVSGAVDAPADFADRLREYGKVKWIPQGWQWVDPEKEIKAIVLAIRAGLLTRSMAVAMYGYDSDEIDNEMAEDNERADRLGLRYESDGRVETAQQLAGPTEPRPEDPNDDTGDQERDDAEAA